MINYITKSESCCCFFIVQYGLSFLFCTRLLCFVLSLRLSLYCVYNLNSLSNFIDTNDTLPEITLFYSSYILINLLHLSIYL